MIINEEIKTEVTDEHEIIRALRRVVDPGTNICLNGPKCGLRLTCEEWNWILDLAVIGLRHEVK